MNKVWIDNEMWYGDTEQILHLEIGENGDKILVLNLGTHPTAYVQFDGIADVSGYDDDKLDDIIVHGGFTFFGTNERCGMDGTWLGWDYAHYMDYLCVRGRSAYEGEHKYTTAEIVREAQYVLKQLHEQGVAK